MLQLIGLSRRRGPLARFRKTAIVLFPLLVLYYMYSVYIGGGGFYAHNRMLTLKDLLNPWRFSISLDETEENNLSNSGQCHIPVIDPFRSDVAHIKKQPRLKCNGKRYGIHTDDGKLLIKAPEFKEAYVEYIQRDGDDFTHKFSEKVKLQPSEGSKDIVFTPEEDFFRLTLQNGDTTHEEYHAMVVKQDNIGPPPKTGLGLNVALIMFDSQSNANFQRMMSEPYKFLKMQEDTVILEGHTIVGDGTTAQLCAMLTGYNEQYLPETRRGVADAHPVDSWPFIFNNFRENGYVTMFTEDMSDIGTFSYRLTGFKEQPTIHYTHSFMSVAESVKAYKRHCIGDQPTHKVMLDYTLEFFKQYDKSLKFSFTEIGGICHNDLEGVSRAEDDFLSFLQDFKRKGFFDNTMVIVFGDHGARVSELRKTVNGKLEERLPFMSITLPTWFKEKHADLFNALKEKSKFLTTHFDIYATLKHVLSYPSVAAENDGRSLFSSFDVQKRTCAQAGVADHWCPCLQMENVDTSSSTVMRLAHEAVSHLNSFIESNADAKKLCSPLTLLRVLRARKKRPNWKVEQFSHSRANSRCDSCVLVFDKRLKDTKFGQYELVFMVSPSSGTYEMTISLYDEEKVVVNPGISRLEVYGTQPHCIAKRWPNLNPFCYCKEQISNH